MIDVHDRWLICTECKAKVFNTSKYRKRFIYRHVTARDGNHRYTGGHRSNSHRQPINNGGAK